MLNRFSQEIINDGQSIMDLPYIKFCQEHFDGNVFLTEQCINFKREKELKQLKNSTLNVQKLDREINVADLQDFSDDEIQFSGHRALSTEAAAGHAEKKGEDAHDEHDDHHLSAYVIFVLFL